MTHSALDSTDLIQVHPHPLVVGVPASAVLLHTHPPLCPKEGILFGLLTGRRHPAVPLAHPH